MHKSKGNISKEIGEENGEVFPSCSNRENLLIRPFTEDVNTRRLFFLFFFLESGYSPVADPEEGAAGPGPLLIFGPNLGPKGRKNFFGRPVPPPPPLSQGLDLALHFIRI